MSITTSKRWMRQTALSFIIYPLSFSSAAAQAPAFPGAEGHGRYVTGGRGGKVVHVTNLNDSGTGSFRQAVSGSDKKIVVFDVGGVIALNSDVNIGANTTILGQTAPGDGITLRYYTVQFSGGNVIMRFVRSRRGEERNVNDGADAIWTRNKTGIILDHCSFSWSIDEVASFYDNNNFTMQWCTIGESLNNAGHDKGAHGYGGIWGGKLASFHHNLILHVNNRSPRFNGARYDWNGYTGNTLYSEYMWQNPVQAENVDFRNCVVYNCGNGCYGGPGGGQINMVNNYYKTGPAGATSRLTTVTVGASGNASGYPIYWTMTSRYYLEGNQINTVANAGWNYMDYDAGTYVINGKRCSPDPSHYYGSDVTYYKNTSGTDCVCIELDEPAPTGIITTHTATDAFNKVVDYAGASLVRDAVDTRYATETRNGTATYTGSVTGKAGRIDRVNDVGGYTLGSASRSADFDTDKDGMPDAWETANGLNPNNASDAQLYTLDPRKFYTNIEVYANSLVQQVMLNGNADATNDVEEYFPAYKQEDGTQVDALNYKKTDDNTPKGSIVAEGSILWSMADGVEQPDYTSDLSDYLQTITMSVGSHLKCFGLKQSDIPMTAFTIADEKQDNVAQDNNAVTFSITPRDGYLFTPTQISFCATRFGTDHGKFQAYWLYPDGTRMEVAPEQLARRDNETPKHTTINETLIDAAASAGASSLVIHLYDIPNNANTKTLGLANVTINGKISSTQSSGISPTQTSTGMVNTTYYNLQGVRQTLQPLRSPYIRMQTDSNGHRITRKVVR